MHFLIQYGYLAAFVLLFLEEAGIPLPVPGDGILIYLGHQAATGAVHPLLAAGIVVVAATGGSSLLYTIARRIGHALLLKYGRWIHMDQRHLERVEGWVQEKQGVAIVFGRLTPGFRNATSIVSGTFEVQYRTFAFFTALASLLWVTFFMSIGAFAGEGAHQLYRAFIQSPLDGLAVLFLVLWAFTVALYVAARRRWFNHAVKEQSLEPPITAVELP